MDAVDRKIQDGYIRWYSSRCLSLPSEKQIESFMKDHSFHILYLVYKGSSIDNAFRKWEMDLNN